MAKKIYSTGTVAEKVGVSRQTLHAWVAAGKIPAPASINLGGNATLVWSASDIECARKFKRTDRKRGPKPKK